MASFAKIQSRNCSKKHCSGIGVSLAGVGSARRMLMAPTTSPLWGPLRKPLTVELGVAAEGLNRAPIGKFA